MNSGTDDWAGDLVVGLQYLTVVGTALFLAFFTNYVPGMAFWEVRYLGFHN